MSNEKMREEFEVWAKSRDLSIVKYAGGMYVSDHTMWASISWFESRAALCVELPRVVKAGRWEDDDGYLKDDVIDAIESTGVRVK